jgi:hypothetical protein
LGASLNRAGGSELRAESFSAPAQAFNTPFDVTVVNPCNTHPITLSGFLHTTMTETLSTSGQYTMVLNQNSLNLKGTDVSGNSYVAYVAQASDKIILHFPGIQGASVETEFLNSIRMVTRSSALNFEVRLLFHVTINPDGSATSMFTNFTATCVG